MEINNRLKTIIFVAAQVLPPLLMFYLAFGRSDIGVSFIIMPPLLYSVCRVPWLTYKKQFRKLLRPTLTIIFAITCIRMFHYYSEQSIQYVKELAQAMQVQCNRDGYCKLPPGDWRGHDGSPTLFHTRTQGLVPITIYLSFNEIEPNENSACKDNKLERSKPFTTFRLNRLIEDHHYIVYGGVGRSLNMPD
jgi:hypothetical protein